MGLGRLERRLRGRRDVRAHRAGCRPGGWSGV